MAAVPRTGGDFPLNGHRMFTLGLWVVVVEVVDEIGDAYSVFRWKPTFIQESPDIAVRGCIDVDGKSGKWMVLNGKKWIIVDPIIGRGIEFRSFIRCLIRVIQLSWQLSVIEHSGCFVFEGDWPSANVGSAGRQQYQN